MKNTQKGFIVPLVIGLVVVLLAGGAYLAYKNEKGQVDEAAQTASQVAAQSDQTSTKGSGALNVASSISTTSWKVYTESDFTISYPSNLNPYSSTSGNLIFTSFAQSSTSESSLNVILTKNSPVSADAYASQFLGLSNKTGSSVVFKKEADAAVGGLTAHVVSDYPVKAGVGGTHVIFQKGNDMYEIVGSGDYATGPIFKEFYSSFHFTNN